MRSVVFHTPEDGDSQIKRRMGECRELELIMNRRKMVGPKERVDATESTAGIFQGSWSPGVGCIYHAHALKEKESDVRWQKRIQFPSKMRADGA